jgi:hypothetical protein
MDRDPVLCRNSAEVKPIEIREVGQWLMTTHTVDSGTPKAR